MQSVWLLTDQSGQFASKSYPCSSLTTPQAQELLEIIEERSGQSSHIFTSQLPVKEWYAYFKNPTLADAIMDRIIHNAYRINLKGESMRKLKKPASIPDTLT